MIFFRSVVVPEHVKGYIYIEAFKQTHVKEAIAGTKTNFRIQMFFFISFNAFSLFVLLFYYWFSREKSFIYLI